MRLTVFLIAAALCAQEPLSIKVDVSLVNVAFIVRDSNGGLTGDLTKDDIEVLEDGVPQQIRFFGRSTDLPLRLALIMDVSSSQDKFNKRHSRDLGAFVGSALGPKDQAMLVCFGDHIRIVSDFSGSARELEDRLGEFQKGGRKYPELDPDDTRDAGTALFDSVYATATRKLAASNGERKAIIVFSDGEDNSSAHDLEDAIDAAQRADSLIYSVRYTEVSKGRLTSRNRYGITEMNRLAKETGGAAFDASQGDVAKSLRQVAEELRSLYDIGYTTTNTAADGRYRNVEIRVKRPGLTVRAKPGYYAR